MARRSNNGDMKDAVKIHLMFYPLHDSIQILSVSLSPSCVSVLMGEAQLLQCLELVSLLMLY